MPKPNSFAEAVEFGKQFIRKVLWVLNRAVVSSASLKSGRRSSRVSPQRLTWALCIQLQSLPQTPLLLKNVQRSKAIQIYLLQQQLHNPQLYHQPLQSHVKPSTRFRTDFLAKERGSLALWIKHLPPEQGFEYWYFPSVLTNYLLGNVFFSPLNMTAHPPLSPFPDMVSCSWSLYKSSLPLIPGFPTWLIYHALMLSVAGSLKGRGPSAGSPAAAPLVCSVL